MKVLPKIYQEVVLNPFGFTKVAKRKVWLNQTFMVTMESLYNSNVCILFHTHTHSILPFSFQTTIDQFELFFLEQQTRCSYPNVFYCLLRHKHAIPCATGIGKASISSLSSDRSNLSVWFGDSNVPQPVCVFCLSLSLSLSLSRQPQPNKSRHNYFPFIYSTLRLRFLCLSHSKLVTFKCR